VAWLPRVVPAAALAERACSAPPCAARLQADNSECSKQFLRAFCNIASGAYFQVPL
jgi:hypothetical protein